MGILARIDKKHSPFISASILAGTLIGVKALGLLRDRALAGNFSTEELGVFFASFKLPDIFFQLLILSLISSAFIPTLAKLLKRDNQGEAQRVATVATSGAGALFALLAVLLGLLARPVSGIIAPGFSVSQRELLARLLRISAFGQIFFAFGSVWGGILQAQERFLIPAVAPLFYNLGILAGIFILGGRLGIAGVAWGAWLGAFLFALIQLVAVAQSSWETRLSLRGAKPRLLALARLGAPRVAGQIATQADSLLDTVLATIISPSAVVYFNFAQHLQALPVALFGHSLAQTGLPLLAKRADDLPAFRQTVAKLYHQAVFLTAPFAVLLLVLKTPLTRLVFGASRFNWQATVNTASTLGFFAFSVVATSSVYLLNRAFFALADAKTATKIAVATTALNSLLSVLLVYFLRLPVWALGMSFSSASILQAVLLLVVLHRRIGNLLTRGFFLPLLKVAFASVLMAISLFIPLKLLDQAVLDTTKVINLLFLTGVLASVGLLVYLLACWRTRLLPAQELARQAKKALASASLLGGQRRSLLKR